MEVNHSGSSRLDSAQLELRSGGDKMYGLLCESLHDFIKESYGDDVWKLVRERADVRLHSFVTHQVTSSSNEHCVRSLSLRA